MIMMMTMVMVMMVMMMVMMMLMLMMMMMMMMVTVTMMVMKMIMMMMMMMMMMVMVVVVMMIMMVMAVMDARTKKLASSCVCTPRTNMGDVDAPPYDASDDSMLVMVVMMLSNEDRDCAFDGEEDACTDCGSVLL